MEKAALPREADAPNNAPVEIARLPVLNIRGGLMESNKFGGDKDAICPACGSPANAHFLDYGIVICTRADGKPNYEPEVWHALRMTKKEKALRVYEALKKMDWHVLDYKLKLADLKGESWEEVKDECFKYLALCSVYKRCAPSSIVDECWHLMILDTKRYEELGSVVGNFIHHSPNDGTKKAIGEDLEAFWETLDYYEETFGEIKNLSIWGVQEKSAEK